MGLWGAGPIRSVLGVDPNPADPNYHRLSDAEFERRVDGLRGRYAGCDPCAYDCRVGPRHGGTGACLVDGTAYVSSCFTSVLRLFVKPTA